MIGIRLFLIKRVLRSVKAKANYTNLRAARFGFQKMVKPYNKPLPHFNYETIKVGEMKAEWIRYRECDNTKVLLYFHGGGYATGGIDTHRAFVSQLAKYSKVSVLLIEYRLAPEHTYPAPIEDASFAFEWLINQGFKAERIAFGGDSAGGGITIGTLAYLRDSGKQLPACAITFSPWVDLTISGKSAIERSKLDPMLIYEGLSYWAKEYLGGAPANSPYSSPIFYSMKNFPPILIQVGEEEMLLDDATRLAERAATDGVEVNLQVYPKMFHVFNAFWRILSEANKANKAAGEFVKQHLN